MDDYNPEDYQVHVMEFTSVNESLPSKFEIVLVRGWGEQKAHFIYALARYEVKTACKRWVDEGNNVLWFEPIEWADLPQR